MSNNLTLTAGTYSVDIKPAASVSGVLSEYGDGPYTLSVQYYNNTAVFNTRPTIEDGSLSNQPRFSQ
jgi:hypothetical protein